MFTVEEKSRTFYFNPDSLESSMQFRLIGIVRFSFFFFTSASRCLFIALFELAFLC